MLLNLINPRGTLQWNPRNSFKYEFLFNWEFFPSKFWNGSNFQTSYTIFRYLWHFHFTRLGFWKILRCSSREFFGPSWKSIGLWFKTQMTQGLGGGIWNPCWLCGLREWSREGCFHLSSHWVGNQHQYLMEFMKFLMFSISKVAGILIKLTTKWSASNPININDFCY